MKNGLDPTTVETYWGDGETAALLPTSERELTVMLYYGDGGVPMPATRDVDAMRAWLLEAYAGYPRHLVDAFALLDANSFVYVDTIAQVRLPSIVRGRVALMGDAAHCPTFLSGMGSSLALQGAHAVALAFERHGDDVTAALAAYARDIAPVAHDYQQSARRVRPMLLSRSHLLGALRNAVVKHAPGWVVAYEAKQFYRVNRADPGL